MKLIEILMFMFVFMFLSYGVSEELYISVQNRNKVLSLEKAVARDEFLIDGFNSLCGKMNRTYSCYENESEIQQKSIHEWVQICNSLESESNVEIIKTDTGWKQIWISENKKVFLIYEK